MESGECIEFERMKNDSVNSRACFLRSGGITFCYGFSCKYRCRRPFEFDVMKIPFRLSFSENEKEYIKKHDYDFLLDNRWIDEHSFYPSDICVGYYHIGREYKPSALPFKHPNEIEDGDILIFFDYDEWENEKGEFETNRFVEFDKSIHGMSTLLLHAVVVKNPKNIRKQNI